MDINKMFSELAQYTRLQEETAAIIEGLKDEIKKYMEDNKTDTVIGDEHKATYKAVTSNRIDTTALKKNAPDVAALYTVPTITRRFIFS